MSLIIERDFPLQEVLAQINAFSTKEPIKTLSVTTKYTCNELRELYSVVLKLPQLETLEIACSHCYAYMLEGLQVKSLTVYYALPSTYRDCPDRIVNLTLCGTRPDTAWLTITNGKLWLHTRTYDIADMIRIIRYFGVNSATLDTLPDECIAPRGFQFHYNHGIGEITLSREKYPAVFVTFTSNRVKIDQPVHVVAESIRLLIRKMTGNEEYIMSINILTREPETTEFTNFIAKCVNLQTSNVIFGPQPQR